MDDARLDAVKARVQPLFIAWIEHLRLQAWHIVFRYERSSGPTSSRGGECVMDTESDWRYLHARITVYAGTVEDISDKELLVTIIHELVHIHLSELTADMDRSSFFDHEERVATCLARAFLQVKNDFSPEEPEGVETNDDDDEEREGEKTQEDSSTSG